MCVYFSQLTLATAKPLLACHPANQAAATMSTVLFVDVTDASLEIARVAGRFKRRNDEEKRVARDHIVPALHKGRRECRERMVVLEEDEECW